MNDIQNFLKETIDENFVVLFMKGTPKFPQCGFSGQAVQILRKCGTKDLFAVDVLKDERIRESIKKFSNWPTIPQLYVNGEFIGGTDIMNELNKTGELEALLRKSDEDN